MSNTINKYFSHDENAHNNPKLMLVLDQLGMEGYGIYWFLIEVLRGQENYRYPMPLVPILAKRMSSSEQKYLTVINSYNLFAIDEDHFFSPGLDERMETMEKKKIKRVVSSKIANAKRWGYQLDSDLNRIPTVSDTDTEQIPNGYGTDPKVSQNKTKQNKTKQNKEKGASAILSISFDDCKNILFSSPQWQMVFQKNNEVDNIQFEQLADEFLKKIETGEEFKNYKYANETRTHFNNWFNQQRIKKELDTKHNKPSFDDALRAVGQQ